MRTIEFDPDLKIPTALHHVRSLGKAGVHFRIAAVFVGDAPFSMGHHLVRDHRDLSEKIGHWRHRAGIPPQAFEAILAPGFVSMHFRQGADYHSMKAQIYEIDYEFKACDLTVQVRGMDRHWHQTAQRYFIDGYNRNAGTTGLPFIKCIPEMDQRGDGRMDYIFPNIDLMHKFCAGIESAEFKAAVVNSRYLLMRPVKS